jgi:hypothetical protein
LSLTYSNKERTLDQIVQGYNKLAPVSSTSYAFNVPRVVINICDRLIQLKEEGHAKTPEILNAFLFCDHDGAKWTKADEDLLEKYKFEINHRKNPLKDIKEPRYLTQLLLDFFSNLSQPVIYSTFRQEWKDVLASEEKRKEFVKCQIPRMVNLKENIYHTLDLLAKSFSTLLGKNPKEQILYTLRLVLLRLTLALTQSENPHFFIARQVLVHDDYAEMASSDSLTDLLYLWVTEYTPAAREAFRGLSSPMPNLHKRLVDEQGTVSTHDPDKFGSKALSSSFIKHQQQHKRARQGDTPHAPVITEEDDGMASQASERNLDGLPEEIRAFIPVFMEMPYEEQNAVIKELNSILQSSAGQTPEASHFRSVK